MNGPPAHGGSALTGDEIRAEAELLDTAERERRQVRQTTSVHPNMTIDEAYRVQAAWLDIRLARGERVIGHKIGLTSRAMQQAMSIDTPDSGFLTDAMEGISLRAGDLILSGSFTRPMAVAVGDDFRFDFGPLGSFSVPIA